MIYNIRGTVRYYDINSALPALGGLLKGLYLAVDERNI